MEARIENSNREETYRILVTESLRLIPQNKWIELRYIDAIQKPKPQKSAEEVVVDVMKRAGLHFKE